MDFSFTFSGPAKVIFGQGSSRQVGVEVKGLGGKKVLIVTDRGVRGAGLVAPIEETLKRGRIDFDTFDDVEANPTIENVNEGSRIFRDMKAESLIGIGGGSSIDTAKAIALVGMTGLSIDHLVEKDDPSLEKSVSQAKDRIPIIALPTTAGTGSEVTTALVIRDKAKGVKAAPRVISIKPAVAICDPLLTLTLPPGITKATGVDAFTHALGSYTNRVFNPIVEAEDLEAIRLVGENLPLVVSRGDNLDARTNMMYASLLAGIAISNTGNDLTHAMALPVEGFFDCTHGEVCSALLPHCVEFNILGDPEKFNRVAQAMGENLKGVSLLEGSLKAVSTIRNFLRRIDMPHRLRDLGIDKGKIQEMSEMAINSRSTQINVRTITLEEIIDLYEKAY